MNSASCAYTFFLSFHFGGGFFHRNAPKSLMRSGWVNGRSLDLWNVLFPPNLRQIFSPLTHSLNRFRSDVYSGRAREQLFSASRYNCAVDENRESKYLQENTN